MTPRVLDLFCGAGGSSWGATMAGAEIVLGIDAWDRAIETYDLNFGQRGRTVLMGPRSGPRDLGLRRGDIDLLLASPECTHHTCAKGAGERSEASKETAHYVLPFARELAPRWIVIENVIHMRSWSGYAPLLDGLRAMGYGCSVEVLDSVEFHVPQTRKRLFILCSRDGTPKPLPRPGGAPISAMSILDIDPVTGTDLWLSRPLITPERAEPTVDRFQTGVKALGKGVPFLLVYYGSDGSGGWQPLDRPLRTITTLDRFGLVTWKGNKAHLRMLQVPELMRAMGFPAHGQFQLTGSRRERIMQLGNGVCPPVMEAIVRHLVELPAARRRSRRGRAASAEIGIIPRTA